MIFDYLLCLFTSKQGIKANILNETRNDLQFNIEFCEEVQKYGQLYDNYRVDYSNKSAQQLFFLATRNVPDICLCIFAKQTITIGLLSSSSSKNIIFLPRWKYRIFTVTSVYILRVASSPSVSPQCPKAFLCGLYKMATLCILYMVSNIIICLEKCTNCRISWNISCHVLHYKYSFSQKNMNQIAKQISDFSSICFFNYG